MIPPRHPAAAQSVWIRLGSHTAIDTLYDAGMIVDPTQLKIQLYPAPILRQQASPVEYTPNVREVALRMLEMMQRADGIGLAAPQVGLPWMLFVANVPGDESQSPEADPATASDEPEVFINPTIVSTQGLPEPMDEGCLSLPGILGEVMRPPTVTLKAQDLDGNWFEKTASGLLARCYQHEFDHLNGELIIDKMPEQDLKRNKNLISTLERRAR